MKILLPEKPGEYRIKDLEVFEMLLKQKLDNHRYGQGMRFPSMRLIAEFITRRWPELRVNISRSEVTKDTPNVEGRLRKEGGTYSSIHLKVGLKDSRYPHSDLIDHQTAEDLTYWVVSKIVRWIKTGEINSW